MTQQRQTGHDSLTAIIAIDRVIHIPARLAIMALLYVVGSADYAFLQEQTGLTSGNLSAHLRKLYKAGYVTVEKGFYESRPNTAVHLTEKGRRGYKGYRANIIEVLTTYE
ncbi:winged helix-turn-helix domain-containing protein [Methanoculleus thermophilus]|uniref:DNA-binding transcriptional regulator, ArsR family n=1 Tax=Methanoculleus thermophilus TaxID=2200 RepID=A0A1G9B0L3_9EURY|nr:transcriptional regulator [Methanoculleus thermophilus]SDK33057.1 DNA-binding transcriptional regulator, ArsR family [Methanoculleus thermophilus]